MFSFFHHILSGIGTAIISVGLVFTGGNSTTTKIIMPVTATSTIAIQASSSINALAQTKKYSFSSSTNSTGHSENPAQFIAFLNSMKNSSEENYPALIEKEILLKHLDDTNFTPEEMSQLSTSTQELIKMISSPSGDAGSNTLYQDFDAITLQIQVDNQQIQNYDFKMDQLTQTEINQYLISQGLPVTQPVPTETTCNSYQGGYSNIINCYTN